MYDIENASWYHKLFFYLIQPVEKRQKDSRGEQHNLLPIHINNPRNSHYILSSFISGLLGINSIEIVGICVCVCSVFIKCNRMHSSVQTFYEVIVGT